MATLTVKKPKFLKNVRGLLPKIVGGIEMPGLKEAASQTYKKGDAVRPDDTVGDIEIAANANAVTTLYGIAAKDATGTTNESVLVRCFQPGDWYVMNLQNNGANNATGALADIGDRVAFNVISGKVTCDKTGVSDTKVQGRVVDIYATDNGYPSADGLIADTSPQYVVELQDGQYWMGSA